LLNYVEEAHVQALILLNRMKVQRFNPKAKARLYHRSTLTSEIARHPDMI
jgi:hypothetical protein